jgi:hypothetical protein
MSGRPLNGDVVPFEKCGSGRRLQQAAKSFPAERTCFDNHPRLHPLSVVRLSKILVRIPRLQTGVVGRLLREKQPR